MQTRHDVPARRRASGRRAAVAALTLTLSLGATAPSEAANEALLKLMQVLRDRGSITAAEYEEIRLVAEAAAPDAPTPAIGAAAPPTSVPTPAAAPRQAAAPPDARVAVADLGPAIAKTLSNKWYEKIGLRGYTQFRYADVLSSNDAPIEVPADRSVNQSESFMIRRGRFIFSGDVTDRLYLYAQYDAQASTGATDFSLQARDLYADLALDKAKAWRVRVGQSKVPYGFVNMQSSQNRAPQERPDALNSAVEGERDLGAAIMWASPEARKRFRDLTGLGLKGSGDYGVISAGVYSGQGLNRGDQNGDPHVFARASYPFKLASGQYVELGVQGYTGRFVSPTQAVTGGGTTFTPSAPAGGVLDQRVALSAVWYPQPFGVEAEWTFGRGPALNLDARTIAEDSLHGGYVQFHYLYKNSHTGTWFPFSRWQYYDGGRKFARNAPHERVNEVDFGLEFARWAEFEITGMFTHTFARTRTSAFPYTRSTNGNRVGVQVQWNY